MLKITSTNLAAAGHRKCKSPNTSMASFTCRYFKTESTRKLETRIRRIILTSCVHLNFSQKNIYLLSRACHILLRSLFQAFVIILGFYIVNYVCFVSVGLCKSGSRLAGDYWASQSKINVRRPRIINGQTYGGQRMEMGLTKLVSILLERGRRDLGWVW